MSSFIGSSIVLEGELLGEESVTVAGTVRGRVALEAELKVEPGGVVEADVEALSVAVSGVVIGPVSAIDKVDIRAEGRVEGDIRAGRILIAEGAVFKGNVEMDD